MGLGGQGLWRWRYLGAGVLAAAGVAFGVAKGWPFADPERVWSTALADFEAKRWDRVEEGLARLARLRVPAPKDDLLRAKLLIARGRVEDALDALARVPDADPMAHQARLVAGQLESQRGRLPAAERLLKESIRLDPRTVQAHRELIYIYGTQLRRPEMEARFRALALLTPLDYDDMFFWSMGRTVIWDPTVGENLSRSLAADPEDRWSRLALAELYVRLKRLDEAEATLAPLPGSDPEAIHHRARIAAERLDFEGARRLLERGPVEHAGLARIRGLLAMRGRDFAAAAAHYRISARLEPGNREGVFGLAQALRLRGEEAEADSVFARLERLDTLSGLLERAGIPAHQGDPTLPRRLGAACAAAGREHEARGWYLVAIARDPLDAEAQRGLHQLAFASSGTP